MSLRRLYGLCAVLVLLAGVVLCRTYWVGQQTAYAASAGGQSVQTLALPRARGDFYDRTGRRLTGLSPRYYALCLPGDAGYTALFPDVPYAEQGLLYERRNLASPFLIQVDRDLTAQGITTCTVPQHFGGSTAADLAVCTPACRGLQLEVAAYPETENIKLPEGIRLADIALAAGNLIGR